MSRIPIEDYLVKLIKLEESVGARTSYQVLDPFHLNARDPIDLQKAAG